MQGKTISKAITNDRDDQVNICSCQRKINALFLQLIDQLRCVNIEMVVKTMFFKERLFKLLISKFVSFL